MSDDPSSTSRYGGIAEETPASFGWPAAIGIALWRASILVAPVLSLVAGVTAFRLSEDVMQSNEWMLDPLLVFFTFGLILVVYLFMSLLSTLAALLLVGAAVLAFVLAIPLGLLLDASLKRTLRGSDGRLPMALLLVGIGGVLSMPFQAAAYPLLGYLALLPLLGYACLAVGRDDLRAHAGERRVSITLACSSCGAALREPAKFCPHCGAPVEASVKPAEA